MSHLLLDDLHGDSVLKPDGSRWRIQITAPYEGWMLYADEWIDAVRALVEDYPAADAANMAELDACFRARRRAALDAATVAQGMILADPENADALERLGPRSRRALIESRDKPVAAVGVWRVTEVALVVVLSSYALANVEPPRTAGSADVFIVDDLGDESLVRSFGELYGWVVETT